MSYVPTAERIKAAVMSTYNAAAEHYDDATFWDHFGQRAVDLAFIGQGASVLDVCCGTGSSALHAADRTGPTGHVTGIDFAERMLERGRVKARNLHLHNVDFVAGDLTALDMPDASFDVVICAFGIFFAPDMATAASELWRVVRPRGTLLVATWGRRLLEPANTIYWDAVQAVRPDLRPATFPWLRIAEPAGLTSLFEEVGAPVPEIESETVVYPASPEDFWTMVLSSGHRLVLDAMDDDEVGHVRAGLMERMPNEYSGELTTDVLYGRARKA